MTTALVRSIAVVVLCLVVVTGGLSGVEVVGAQTAGASISVGASPSAASATVSGQPGDRVTVTVWVDAADVAGYQARLTYDSDVVRVRSVSASDDFGTPVSRVDNGAGLVEFNQLRASGVDDPVLARLTLELTGDAGSQTSLEFTERDTKLSDSGGSEIGIDQYTGTTVSIEAAETPTATPTPEPTPTTTPEATPTATPTPESTLTATPTPESNDSDVSDTDGSDSSDSDGSDSDEPTDESSSQSRSSRSSSSGGGGGGGSVLGPRTIVSVSNSMLGGSSVTANFGGASPTVRTVELAFARETAGLYSVAELSRPPADTEYPRNYDTVVTVLEIDAPTRVADDSGTVELTLDRAGLDVDSGRLQVEQYDPDSGTWTTLSSVTRTTETTVTIRADVPEFGLLAVTQSVETPTPPPTEEASTTAQATETPTPTSTTDDRTPTAQPVQTTTTTSTTFGYPVPPAIVALVLVVPLAGYLLARRR